MQEDINIIVIIRSTTQLTLSRVKITLFVQEVNVIKVQGKILIYVKIFLYISKDSICYLLVA